MFRIWGKTIAAGQGASNTPPGLTDGTEETRPMADCPRSTGRTDAPIARLSLARRPTPVFGACLAVVTWPWAASARAVAALGRRLTWVERDLRRASAGRLHRCDPRFVTRAGEALSAD